MSPFPLFFAGISTAKGRVEPNGVLGGRCFGTNNCDGRGSKNRFDPTVSFESTHLLGCR